MHLSREVIARAALETIDRDGLEGFSVRRLAAGLGVSPMTLYRYVPDRDAILKDVLALLLSEIDKSEKVGESWDETVRRILHSIREMAWRHPRAFELGVLVPPDQPPMLDHARAIGRLAVAQGCPEQRFVESWSVIGPFVVGFLLLETASIARPGFPADGPRGDAAAGEGLQEEMSHVLSTQAFDRALNVVIAGLRQCTMIEE